MRDRYYILLLMTAIAVLSGWLVGFLDFNQTNVVAYDGRFEVPKQVTTQEEVLLLGQVAKQKVLGEKVLAASSSVGLPESEYKPVDPIRVRGGKDFNTSASSAVIINEETGHVLFAENSQTKRAIASITKLFTALVFLDFNPGWEKVYQIKNSDRREGGRIYTWTGEKLKVKDLFNLSLVASGNTETIALINATGLGEELFVKKMNLKAKELGLTNTVFKDAVGLNEENTSTAEDVARFAKVALSKKEIAEAVTIEKFQCTTQAGRVVKVLSTDELLGSLDDPVLGLEGGKTGFNNRAGYCFVGKFNNDKEHPIISVILGESTKNSRFAETKDMVKWTYDNYAWPELK